MSALLPTCIAMYTDSLLLIIPEAACCRWEPNLPMHGQICCCTALCDRCTATAFLLHVMGRSCSEVLKHWGSAGTSMQCTQAYPCDCSSALPERLIMCDTAGIWRL